MADQPGYSEVLNEILNRLQRMEGGLSQHEQWLRRMEEERRQSETKGEPAEPPAPADSELQQAIGTLTLERQRDQKALADAQQQLARYQKELQTLRARSNDLQNRLGEREGQLVALKGVATGARQQLEARDRQLAELQQTVDEAAQRFDALSENLAAQGETPDGSVAGRGSTRFLRFAVVAAFASAIASVGLTGWFYHRQRETVLQTVTTTLLLPATDARTFRSCAQQAAREPYVAVYADARRGRIELRHRTRNVRAGIDRLNKLSQTLISNLETPAYLSTTRPAEHPEALAIAARIVEIDRRLNGAVHAAPGTLPEDAAALAEWADDWQRLTTERARVAERIDELRNELESLQAQPSAAPVEAEQLAQAEAADPQIQAETEALRQREDQLATRLRVSIETTALQFRALHQKLTEVAEQLKEDLRADQPEGVAGHLASIDESLGNWSQALTELESVWKQQQALLEAPDSADPLAIQPELEKSSRAFIQAGTGSSAAITRAIDAIGEGQDQTTKRLVLRNALTKQFAPVAAAQQSVSSAVRAVILSENIELTAIVQRLDALRRQIQQRRIQLAATLRQEKLTSLQNQRSTQAAQLRQEQQTLTARAAGIDAQLLELGEQATQRTAQLAQVSRQLDEQTALLQRQNRDLKALVSLHERFMADWAELSALPAPGYLPAVVLADSGEASLHVSALLLGITPVLGCAAILALLGLIISSRRSRQTIDEYARTLKETAQRASLTESGEVQPSAEDQPVA